MKRVFILITATLLVAVITPLHDIGAQDAKSEKMVSKQLLEEGKALDKQIYNLNKQIQAVVIDYKLMSDDVAVRILPFQTTYQRGKGYIIIEKHDFIRSDINLAKIIGIKKKKIRIVTDGKKVSKLETVIMEQHYDDESVRVVLVNDNTPNTPETNDIVFEYIINDKTVKELKFDKVRNTTAFPIRNDLKRNFLVPHLSYFYQIILNIGETYQKGTKDSESQMAEFLKRSVEQ